MSSFPEAPMVPFLLATAIHFDFAPGPVPEPIAKHCAEAVGVPYGSDNFTDGEWMDFKRCILQNQ